jgi:hypothetical protein
VHLLGASDPATGTDGPLAAIVGIAVGLIFAGIVVRALLQRWPTHTDSPTLPERSTNRQPPHALPAGQATRPPDPPPIALADVPEPELTRLEPSTLIPLGRTLDRSRRFRAAEDLVARKLHALPHDFWLVERYVVVGARRIPFLVAGGTGVFVIAATDGAWTIHDLDALSDAADDVRSQLLGYHGPVHAVMCLAFDEMTPRNWHGGTTHEGRGGWVLGLDWLTQWMFSFGPQDGLRNGDVRHLREASGPFWDKRSTARLPQTPNLG